MKKIDRSIVFVNQATGYLTIDIINEFVKSGYFKKVAIIAGSIRVQDIPISDTVNWSKVILYNRGNPAKKFFSWLVGTLQIGWLLLTKYRKYEIFYITIPPFAYLLSLILRNRFSILIFDVYPNVLTIYNISERNFIYKLWVRWNKILFNRAHCLFTLGESMSELLSQYVDQSKIKVIHNWSGLTKVREIPKEKNSFLKEHHLEDKFIVQYSGNIGYTHNVEILVEIAKLMIGETDLFFLIIGRGEKYNEINKKVESEKIVNCKLLPFQPDDRLNDSLSAADLGVVLLDDKTAHVSIPSKIYNLQVVGVPILGIAATNSELAKHLKRYNSGMCFSQNDKQSIMDYIIDMKRSHGKLKELQQNARAASALFTNLNANKYLVRYVQEMDEEIN